MSIRVTLALTALGLGLVPAVAAHPAHAGAIYTGGEKGAYHSTFCPLVEGAMAKQQFDYKCTPSEGSKDNIAKVLASPADIGFAQFDVFALEKAKISADQLLPIRTDLGRECLFMVTKNKDIKTFGEVQALAAHLRFILPPQKSGTNGTFDYLKSIDPDGIGQAANVSYAKDGDEALSLALSAEDTITLFVQFPDPKNARFAKIAEMGGHFVPVLDRAILRQSLGDEKVYYADETEVEQTRWTKSTDKIVTACTPMVLFTGLSEMIDTGTKRLDHDDLVRTLKAIPAADLQPKIGFFARLWKKTKEFSAVGVEKLIVVSEKARVAAKPMVDQAMKKAGELGQQATDKAKELLDSAKKGAGLDGTADPAP